MAKVLPFVPKPAPLFSRKRRRKPPSPRGVSFTLQINADDVATELIRQLEDKGPQKVTVSLPPCHFRCRLGRASCLLRAAPEF